MIHFELIFVKGQDLVSFLFSFFFFFCGWDGTCGCPVASATMVASTICWKYIYCIVLPLHFIKDQLTIFVCSVAQSCPVLCYPKGCSLSGSYVHWNFHARILEWAAVSYSRVTIFRRAYIWPFSSVPLIYLFHQYHTVLVSTPL